MDDHKPLFIADASVLLKWMVNEPELLEEALAFRKDFENEKIEIIVPAHCYAEICNMLGRGMRDIAISFISYLITSEIDECHLTFDTASVAFRLMGHYSGISFYDANYHALAIQQKGIFLTADIQYFQKTRKEGHIMLLKDYGKKK